MWKQLTVLVVGVIVLCFTETNAQNNASPQLQGILRECYQNQSIYHRENRLPATLSTFLSLLRKVEAGPSAINLNAREVALALQHYFRMDGIEPSPGYSGSVVQQDPSVVPFAASGPEYFRQRLALVRLLSASTSQGKTLLTENLSTVEMCNLHFLLSNSIDRTKRLGESCANVQQEARRTDFRRGRYGRSLPEEDGAKEVYDPKKQVEPIPVHQAQPIVENKEDFTIGKEDLLGVNPLRGGYSTSLSGNIGKRSQGKTSSLVVERSDCPVANGVVMTKYGSVNMGTVVAGIAAGLSPQSISLKDFAVNTSAIRPELANLRVDNVWATTLAGDLAEVIMSIGILGGDFSEAIGLKGGWNNTLLPKWYLLSKDEPQFVWDVQLRASLDGLWLGKNIKALADRVTQLKLSHILEMYYSDNGLLNTDIRACKRREAYPSFADPTALEQQLELFSIVLSYQRPNTATVIDFRPFVEETITNINAYASNFDAGSNCPTNSIGSLADASSKSDYYLKLALVIDKSWPDQSLLSIISALIEQKVITDIYTSNTTVICGQNGQIIYQGVSATELLYNISRAQCNAGLDLSASLTTVETMYRRIYLEEQKLNKESRGAMAVLLLPYSNNNINSTAINQRRQSINITMPDIKFVVATNGPKDGFSSLVDDVNSDAFTVQSPTPNDPQNQEQIKLVASRLKSIPQRLAFVQCGSYMDGDSGTGTTTLLDNVQPGLTKFYRLHPNYFYDVDGIPKIKVRSVGGQPLTVCTSRTTPTPTDPNGGSQVPNNPNNPINPNNNNQPTPPSQSRFYYTGYARQSASPNCPTVTAATALPLDDDPCSDYSTIGTCPPIYISVTAPLTTDVPPALCNNPLDCRYPTNIQYEITLEELSCDSGVAGLISSIFLVSLTMVIVTFRLL